MDVGSSPSSSDLQETESIKHQMVLFFVPSQQVKDLMLANRDSIKFRCFSKTQRNLIKPFTEKITILDFGSFLFMGKFYCKPALAEISETSTSSKVTDNEEMYLMVLEQNPRNFEALKVVLYGNMRSGKTKEAVKYVERLIEIEPGEVEWKLLQAPSYEMLGELSKVKRLFEDILVNGPLLLRALHGLAMVMHKNHEDAELFEMLSKALEVANEF